MYSERIFINNLFKSEKEYIGKEITVCGMIQNIRKQANIAFVELNDGTMLKGLQIIMDTTLVTGDDKFDKIFESGTKGTIISCKGKIIQSPSKGQTIEMTSNGDGINYFDCIVESKDYPVSKNRLTLDYLRSHLHLRMRTNMMSSVMRIRSKCSYYTHNFFQEQDFQYIHTPLLTSSDCEGAGETFTVTNLLPEKIEKDSKIEDYDKDFFGKKTSLTVSGQLNVECYAMYFSKVYTFGPTFRAENSNTSRHLAEFWMIEPEITYINLDELMSVAEDYLKFCINKVIENYFDELKMFDSFSSPGIIVRLTALGNKKFDRITYTEAIELYNKRNPQSTLTWGDDLSSEVEKYLCERVFENAIIIYNYPSEIKAFYMKENDDGKTVQAFDILVPGIGELVGGSIREERHDVLKNKIEKNNISVESLQWYLDLRKFGTCPHGGFGLGFERLIMLVTGISNIRDVIPFPRYPNHCVC